MVSAKIFPDLSTLDAHLNDGAGIRAVAQVLNPKG